MYNPILYLLLLLAFVVLVYLLYKHITRKGANDTEGFQQDGPFILKTENDIYDDFYGEIYDKLMLPQQRIKYEMNKILQTVTPSREHSIMLDVGSGTGELIAYLRQQGYTAYGVDKSQAMVDIAQSKIGNITDFNISSKATNNKVIKCANAEDPMTYDRALFSHIFCMNFTIYEIENKSRFFENCHYWLRNNGYLIIHLADKDNFDAIIPAGKPTSLKGVSQIDGKRIKNTFIDFIDFTYKSEFNPDPDNTKQLIHKETFTDKATQNVRQNEKTLRMETMEEIIDMARIAGLAIRN
jgi:SAM-dependent methyltransferase